MSSAVFRIRRQVREGMRRLLVPGCTRAGRPLSALKRALGPRAARIAVLVPGLLFLTILALYAATAAPGTLFGDPSEYQFIPAILGIAHPPGYAFYILLARLWQLTVPIGTIAYRTNLLSAAVGAWAVTALYLLVRDLQRELQERGATSSPDEAAFPQSHPFLSHVAALFGAMSLAASPDMWQHSIHANPHIVSAALGVTHLWLLTRWARTERDFWLGAFGLTMGLAATHHPVTLMGVPAYGLFILAVRGWRLFRWNTVLVLVGCLLIGLSPLLYYPLRSPQAPFGPTDMNTWDGFTRHTTARGLRVNLFHFGLSDQPDRAIVFWSLLRLQFLLPAVLLMPVGLVTLVRRCPKAALLLGAFAAGHLAFTLNTVQDVMAYLLLPFAALAGLAGVGASALLRWSIRILDARFSLTVGRDGGRRLGLANGVLAVSLLLLPAARGAQDLHRGISLRDFEAAERWVDEVYDRFEGEGKGAVLLSAWEYLTPLWVHAYTEGQSLTAEDVDLEYVSTATPWAQAVWSRLESGPLYLPDYRPSLRQAGFRLIPDGVLYRVELPPVTAVDPSHPLDLWADSRVHILGYDLAQSQVRAGEPLELTIYQSIEEPMEGIWMPYATLGEVEARWTTDSRLLTTQWEPGEVVVERYELPVPFHMEPGEYPLRIGYADLSGGRPILTFLTGETSAKLGTVTVVAPQHPSDGALLRGALANFDNQLGLVTARARQGVSVRRDVWAEPLAVEAGDYIRLTLKWQALATPRESATVFIHLIDGANRPVAGWDYTPLGGSAPTYLWFPKWLPGQTYTDPYRLSVPSDLPQGDYRLEVGAYGMISQRRFPVVDWEGDLAGDRVVLGPVHVE